MELNRNKDIFYMQQALAYAESAGSFGEVPVGAVLVLNGELITGSFNQTIAECDPTAHAEILVLREAAKRCRNHRLLNATLYVTLEPCLMCLGAIIQARIKRLVFGAYDSRHGAIVSTFSFLQSKKKLNHSFEWTDGLLSTLCAEKLQQFFIRKRQNK